MEARGCLIGAVGAAVFGLILGLVLLFAIAGANASGTGGLGVGGPGALNTGLVPAQYVSWVEQAGATCPAVSAPLIAAQIQQESTWDPNAISPAGAMGIAQFLQSTWDRYGVAADGRKPPSPFDAADGIVSMGIYDCALAAAVADVPGEPTANMLAAYNAGLLNVERYGGVPPFAQTQHYVQAIEADIPRYTLAAPSAGPPSGPAAGSVGAAGYIDPFTGDSVLTPERTDQGVDYALAPGEPIRAIGLAHVEGVIHNWFDGEPLIWYQLLDGPYQGAYVYVAEQIDDLADVGQQLQPGQAVAYYAASGTGIETGWALANGGTLASANGGYTEGRSTAAGESFRLLLASLGVPTCTDSTRCLQMPLQGTVPAGYPSPAAG